MIQSFVFGDNCPCWRQIQVTHLAEPTVVICFDVGVFSGVIQVNIKLSLQSDSRQQDGVISWDVDKRSSVIFIILVITVTTPRLINNEKYNPWYMYIHDTLSLILNLFINFVSVNCYPLNLCSHCLCFQ